MRSKGVRSPRMAIEHNCFDGMIPCFLISLQVVVVCTHLFAQNVLKRLSPIVHNDDVASSQNLMRRERMMRMQRVMMMRMMKGMKQRRQEKRTTGPTT